MIELDHLDCNITLACNKTCVSCSHASPFMKPAYWMKPSTLKRDLESLGKAAHFQTAFCVGGEPTLHPDLISFLDVLTESGISDEVGVISNGAKLQKLGDDFYSKLDVLRWSIYGEKDLALEAFLLSQAEQHGFRLDAWAYPEFYAQLKKVPDDGVESFKTCEWRTNCFTVHEGVFGLCPQSLFFPPRFLGHESTDGLSLTDLTEENLTAFLNRSHPFEACKICCANEKRAFPWTEAKSRQDWLTNSTL